jgi:protein involved in polysaccharide export with SLBB domain
MKPGQGPSSWKRCRACRASAPAAARRRVERSSARAFLLVCLACLAPGCAIERAKVERNLMSDKNNPVRSEGVSDHYLVHCPDVLDLRVSFRPEWSKRYPVAADGCIDLGDYGRVRVEGKTPPAIARLVADELGMTATEVKVRVAEYRSQQLLLFGQVVGWQRSVPYQGQETVLDVLQRVGGITPGAEPREVYVVRTHFQDGSRPELFQIDLDAIVVKKDMATNIRVLPYDQIYVGETRKARIERNIPPLLRPVLGLFWPDPPVKKNSG